MSQKPGDHGPGQPGCGIGDSTTSMKKVRPPNSSAGRNCYGVTHVHSTRSFDGQCSYAELRRLFQSQNLDFACITEHIETLDQAAINRIIDECRSHSDGDFLFVPGIEMDCYRVNFMGLAAGTIDFTSDRTVFDSLRSLSRLCILAHPVKSRFTYADWILQAADGLEIWNTRHDGFHDLRPQNAQLYRRLLIDKPDAIKLAGIDLHAPGDYRALTMHLVITGDLTEATVLGQIQQNRTQILKAGRPIDAVSLIARLAHRTRIRIMDRLQAVHRQMTDRGLAIPRPIKRIARRLAQG